MTMFTIPNLNFEDDGSLVPLFVRKNGDLVMVENHAKLWSFNPKDKSILDIQFPQQDRYFKGFMHVGSLASVCANTCMSLRSVQEEKICWIDENTLVDE
ncbi:hypothetical protein ACH5RR_032988 [Cinchona calisaya]|uniref:Uncharacterized protein n=1 Tax=Cinchona calisaya TaxID=153742 RepID=A0ABD2YJP7_9GENT